MKVLYLKITNRCNMNCPFCYEKKGNDIISMEKIEEIYNKFFPDKIILHGGEPLLYVDKCLEIINKFPNSNYAITSNLTIPLNDKIWKVLDICELSTSYSIDRFSNNNSFEQFLKNVKEISKKKKINLLVTLTRDQLKQDPNELYKVLKNIPCDKITLERLYEEEYDKNLAIQTDEYLKKLVDIIPENQNVILQNIYKSINTHAPLFANNCKDNVITINADNSIQICPNCSNDKITKKRNKECLECDLFEYCRRDCLSYRNGCMFPKETFKYVQNKEVNNGNQCKSTNSIK